MGEIFSNQKGRTIYNRQQYILNRERKRRLTWITPRRPTRYYHHQVLFGDGITTATAYILYRWLCMYVCGCESEKSAQKRKENDSEGRAIWISVRCGYGSGPEVYIYIAPPFSLFYILLLLLLRDLSIKTYTFFLFFYSRVLQYLLILFYMYSQSIWSSFLPFLYDHRMCSRFPPIYISHPP